MYVCISHVHGCVCLIQCLLSLSHTHTHTHTYTYTGIKSLIRGCIDLGIGFQNSSNRQRGDAILEVDLNLAADSLHLKDDIKSLWADAGMYSVYSIYSIYIQCNAVHNSTYTQCNTYSALHDIA